MRTQQEVARLGRVDPAGPAVVLEGSSVAEYNVIGWVAFHLDSFDLNAHGGTQIITGYFTRVIWDGIQSAADEHVPDFGVYSVSLVK